MSKYLQMYELALLQLLFEAAEEKELITKKDSNMCLCHDGAMIPKSAFAEENTIESFINFLNKKKSSKQLMQFVEFLINS